MGPYVSIYSFTIFNSLPMVPALINAQIIFSYLWLLYGDVHMEAIYHWD